VQYLPPVPEKSSIQAVKWLMAFFQDILVSRHQKGKQFWNLKKQEMMGGSGISWTICK